MSASDEPAAPANPPYRTRLSVLFAADAPKAVILRRGPKTHFHLITWDLATDSFTPGQWMKGVVGLCDLSPDGGKLLYWAAQYHIKTRERLDRQSAPYDPISGSIDQVRRPKRKIPRYLRSPAAAASSWTAISTPPYFTALAIWALIGGGVFRSGRDIVLWEGPRGLSQVENAPMPTAVRVRGANTMAEMQPSAYAPALDNSDETIMVRRALTEAGAEWVDWVNLRQGADMLFAADGRIYELKCWAQVPPQRYLADARMLADFRDMRFQLLRAPATAMHW